MLVKIVKAKVRGQKVNCHLEPGFYDPSMGSDKFLKKIDGKINRKLTPEEKDSKFVKEEITAPLGLAIIPLTFISNIKNNLRFSNKKSITILTEVLVEEYDPKMPNYILLSNNWFYGRSRINDKIQHYLPEIVTDAKNAFVKTTLRIKDLKTKKKPRVIVSIDKRDIHDFYKLLPGKSKNKSKTRDSVSSLSYGSNISATSDSNTSDSDTSNSDSSNSSTSSLGIEVIHITRPF
ncbi:hypothetical protein Glove_131g60 [Diversispora epigaea]|uniref:Uncharacterized protein n=1 Tax=Diversispora epigaea TaxID=1348612 RepID=A0A397J7Y5_9GLOM|nr:hypothetical protein Glove_131g60 [Diversispora epigaea]